MSQQAVRAWPQKTRDIHNHHMNSQAWDNFKFRDDDIVIATYAKSGTTWMQQIVGQLIFNGAGESKLENAVQDLVRRHPKSVAAQIGYDDDLAKDMFVGSDFLLMPSRFEPCGLGQMYAQKVGTLPIAHRTGGLSETIEDGQSGFLFSSATTSALRSAINRAFGAFASRAMPAMRRNAMGKAFAWTAPARQYAGVYAKLLY